MGHGETQEEEEEEEEDSCRGSRFRPDEVMPAQLSPVTFSHPLDSSGWERAGLVGGGPSPAVKPHVVKPPSDFRS